MSTNVEIINQLKSILAGASDLSFVQRIFIGARSNVVEVPAISIIPESEEDITNTLPVIRKALNCKIYGMNRIFEEDGVFMNNTNDSKIGIFLFSSNFAKTSLSFRNANIIVSVSIKYAIQNLKTRRIHP